MAYRVEKKDLVFDGFEEGIADSPFKGIGNIRNLDIKYYDGVAYVNYKRKAATITGATMAAPRYACQSPDGIIYISDENGAIFKQSAVNGSTFAALTGCPGTPSQGLQWWNNYLFAWSTTTLNICGDGTGDAGITSSNWNTGAGTGGVWPVANATITLTGSPSAGDTSATISTYNDAQGNARAFWNGPTGTYNVTFNGVSGTFVASMVQGTAGFDFTPALPNAAGSSSMSLKAITTIAQGHNSLVSINDGNMYFCNNSDIGSMNLLPFQVFSKTKMNGQNFTFNSASLSLPPTEASIQLTELRNQLLVGVAYKIYPWDRVSPQWTNPIPIQEQFNGMINILNNIYIFAGNKGNIYISNGYNVQRFKKMPDYIAGVLDPAWNWMQRGNGCMSHRQKLFFMAQAVNGQTNATILSGIFSLDLDSGALNMEAQNSFGLNSASATSQGILIDNNSISLNYDNYYSSWATTVGGIDFNDTTLWSSGEAVIETDIAPIGTCMEPTSFTSAEFKLDRPMKSGDSIALYARKSLSDSFTLLGTTTSTVLSAFITNTPISNWQWLQLEAVITCNATATSSSRVPIREIRLRQ
jgi:hypothetical protein